MCDDPVSLWLMYAMLVLTLAALLLLVIGAAYAIGSEIWHSLHPPCRHDLPEGPLPTLRFPIEKGTP